MLTNSDRRFFFHVMLFLYSIIFLIFFLTLTSAAQAAGGSFYVTTAGAGSKDGLSWETAFNNQAFVDKLNSLSEDNTDPHCFFIASGDYDPKSSDLTASFFIKKNVRIYGGFRGTEGTIDSSNLSAKLASRDLTANRTAFSGQNTHYHVIQSGNYCTSADSCLDGLFITKGNANGSGTNQKNGGGILINEGVTIKNCTLENNSAAYNGGAVYIDGSTAQILIENCTFNSNTATSGGGICSKNYDFMAAATIKNCTFSNNTASSYGGGIFNNTSKMVITDCSFFDNNSGQASREGGGIDHTKGKLNIQNCTFRGNSGGLCTSWGCTLTAVNCTFSGNTYDGMATNMASPPPGAVHPIIVNCTFYGNGCYGLRNDGDSSPVIVNCAFWGNQGTLPSGLSPSGKLYDNDLGYTSVAVEKVRYCVIGSAGVLNTKSGCFGNVSGNPNLQALSDNGGQTQTCALGAGSSAINAGSATYTDHGGISQSAPTTDQRGYSRTGSPDIGAYEDGGAPIIFTVTATAGANGSISPGSASVNSGANCDFTISPDAGYKMKELLVSRDSTGYQDRSSDASQVGKRYIYTLQNVTAPCDIRTTFEVGIYTVNSPIIDSSKGRIEDLPSFMKFGESYIFRVIPNSGYEIDSVAASAGSLARSSGRRGRGDIRGSGEGRYTISNVTDDITITVTFNTAPSGSGSTVPVTVPPSSSDVPSQTEPVVPSGDVDPSGYKRSDDISPEFPTKVESSDDVRAEFIEANEMLASSDVVVLPGNSQPPMTDVSADEVIVDELSSVDLVLFKPNAERLPVCFIPSGKDALELTADVRKEVEQKFSGRGDSANIKALLPMTYIVRISRAVAAPLFGAATDRIFAAPLSHLGEIFKYYVIQTELRQGERKGWFTRLVRGIMTPEEAVSKGVLKVESNGSVITLTLSYYVRDGSGEAFVRGSYLILPDGLTDGIIKDPIWLNKWAKACSSSASSASSGGGGCGAGFGLPVLAIALALARKVKGRKAE